MACVRKHGMTYCANCGIKDLVEYFEIGISNKSEKYYTYTRTMQYSTLACVFQQDRNSSKSNA